MGGFVPDGLPSRAEAPDGRGVGGTTRHDTLILRRAGRAAVRDRAKGVAGVHKRLWLLAIGVVALLGAGVVGALAISGGDPDKPAIRAVAETEGAAEEDAAAEEAGGEFGEEGEEEEEEEGLGPAEPDDYFL